MSNNVVAASNAKKLSFSMTINQAGYMNFINKSLGDPKKAARFISAITSAVVTTPALQECDAMSIVSAGLLGESLALSPSPQLGQYYMVPFNDNKNDRKVAQFILGYKGYIQLAIRSGQYKKMTVIAIKEGELINFDPLIEEIEVKLIEDEAAREAAPTIGYYAMFEYINGFRKAIYWSKNKMLAHADRFSPAFSKDETTIKVKGKNKTKVSFEDYEKGNYPQEDAWMYSSFWYKDFDGMAYKTMLRQLISKWGIMSTEMQDAYTRDGAMINQDGSADFLESEDYQSPVGESDGEVIEQDEPSEEVDINAL